MTFSQDFHQYSSFHSNMSVKILLAQVVPGNMISRFRLVFDRGRRQWIYLTFWIQNGFLVMESDWIKGTSVINMFSPRTELWSFMFLCAMFIWSFLTSDWPYKNIQAVVDYGKNTARYFWRCELKVCYMFFVILWFIKEPLERNRNFSL